MVPGGFAAVAHLVQGSMCFAFKDALLHSLVVTTHYLTRYFLIFRLFSVIPKNDYGG